MRISDWSSDVCSSDLLYNRIGRPRPSSTHDRPRDMTDFDRSMRGTLGSGASRILNVAQTTRRLEVAADAAGGGPPGRLLFGHREIGRAHVELQSLMRISYAVFCLKKKNKIQDHLRISVHIHTELNTLAITCY